MNSNVSSTMRCTSSALQELFHFPKFLQHLCSWLLVSIENMHNIRGFTATQKKMLMNIKKNIMIVISL